MRVCLQLEVSLEGLRKIQKILEKYLEESYRRGQTEEDPDAPILEYVIDQISDVLIYPYDHQVKGESHPKEPLE